MSELTEERTVSAVNHEAALAPGSGTWTLDASHCPRPICRFVAPLLRESFVEGFSSTFTRYGLLLDHLDVAVVRGFLYSQVRVLGAPPEASGHPPREVFDQILAGSPPLQERVATADEVWRTRRWREDLARWDGEVKPARIALRDALDAVDLAALPDAGLADHLATCRDGYRSGWAVHHTFNGAAMLPVGDYLVQAHGWTGRPPGELLGALAGASPITAGDGPELGALATALRADPEALAFASAERDPAEILAGLHARGGEVAAALAAYERIVRFSPVEGWDSVGSPTTVEEPDLLLSRVRSALDALDALDARAGDRSASADAAAESIRAAVPAEFRDQFDELLAEARLVYRLRDERAVHGDRELGTVTRRALLEVGRRLVARGRLDAAEHAVDLEFDEIVAMLEGGPGPSPAEVAERVLWRLRADYREMPPLFGEPPGPPLPAEWLPPGAARVHGGMGFALAQLFADVGPGAALQDGTVQGMAVGGGVREGTARVLHGPDDLNRVRRGDVLITTSTGAAFNIVLPILAGLVTDRGGLLSHAAIVAREFGLPAVVGCAIATLAIPDGARVRIDGDAGTVTLL